MIIKLGKFETQFNEGLLAIGLVVADSIYANHCKKKVALSLVKNDDQKDQDEQKEEEPE